MNMEKKRLSVVGASGRSRLDNLRLRAHCLSAFRESMKKRGIMEVETPALIRYPGLELHLDPIPVFGEGFLATSPEFQMKRLLAGGSGSIYYLGKAFRRGERGPHHNPEFTIAEWYRVGMSYKELMDETAEIVAEVAREVLGTTVVKRHGGGFLDLSPPWKVVTVEEAFGDYAGIRIGEESSEAWKEPNLEAAEALRVSARQVGVRVPDDSTWEETFFRIFVEYVEPKLNCDGPVFLTDWPVTLAALSRVNQTEDGRRFAERFEIYGGGVELANAFGELVDPQEQRMRMTADVRHREDAGKPVYGVDETFLSALEEGLPECSGIAMGFDRLVMLLAGSSDIKEVSAFVFEEV